MHSLLVFSEKPAPLPFSNLTDPVAPDGVQTLEHNPALIHGDILTMPGLPRGSLANPIRPGARGEVQGLF